MPEAEDVLLEAAEWTTAAVRGLWERGQEGDVAREREAVRRLCRRLSVWQAAWLSRSWPVVPVREPPGPGRFERIFRSLPGWIVEERRAASCDGRQIWIPDAWLACPTESDRALVTTLGLAQRMAFGRLRGPLESGRAVRDVWWFTEAQLAETAMARAWPGLVPKIEALRREALAARPDPAGLRPCERPMERFVRELLERPATVAGEGLEPEPSPAKVVAFARERASRLVDDPGRYRGAAPVAHWGVHRPIVAEPAAATGPDPAPAGRRPSRGARLRRPLKRRPPEASEEERSGPFVIPFADPHLTVDDPGGFARPPERGHDEDLDALTEELSRLDELPVVRHRAEVREILEDGGTPSEEGAGAVSTSSEGIVWLYPEWDCGREGYRSPGCRVHELPASSRDAGWAEAALVRRRTLLARLKRQLEGLRTRRQRLRREPSGDDLDVDGWVEDWSDRRAGGSPAGRVYTLERSCRRDVAVTLLLDTSGSTESWLSGSQRVIDVVKESALAFSEALASLEDRFALLAFSGQGADRVRLRVLKRFEEAPGPVVQRRIGALEPDAFTRLGGALRHATAGLARESARARLLLVLTDGKPQDEDGYEGRYGVEDARQAVAEARMQGVRVFGVTVDREGPDYLPRLFGANGYTVIWDPETLPERLTGVYRRLTASA